MSLMIRHFPFRLIAALSAVIFYGMPLEAGALSLGKSCKPEFVDVVRAETVASVMSYNGTGQNISRIESSASRDEVIKAYVIKWRSTHAEPLEAKVVRSGNWEIVSKIVGTCLHTVQLDKRSYGASGYVSSRELDVDGHLAAAVPGKSVPKLYGSHVLSDIFHNDPGKKARTLLIVNNFSVDANADFYFRNFGGDGWKVLNDHHVPIQKRDQAARAITFGKAHEQHIIVISESKSGSNVVVQWMEKP
jgi:hypothetical protein